MDVNEAPDPGEPPPPPTPECASADTARVRFFHGAPGTPQEKEPGKPARTPNVVVFGTKTGVKERTLVSFQFGRAATARLCAGTYDLRIALDNKAKTALASVSAFSVTAGQKFTIVASGYVAPTTGQDAFRVLPQLETFTTQTDGQGRLIVVHASPDAPTVDVDLDPEAAGANATGLARYGATAILPVPGNSEVSVGLLVGATAAETFDISRFPANVNLFGIVFGTDTATTSRSLFLTGDDELFGNTTRGGITISGS